MKKYSIWCDFIENNFLDNEFMDMLNSSTICGATSNPSIFKNAITTSSYYKTKIEKLNIKNKEELFLALALEDIKKAANKMAYLNNKNSDDGFISFEINPFFSNNAAASISEALKIVDIVNMPNLMIKVPATESGYEVMNVLSSKGININATLIFSADQAKKCDEAISLGIKEYQNKHTNIIQNRSVISIFVSRIDNALNNRYSIKNMIGIHNAIYCAAEIKGEFNRALFASTGVKSESLNKDYYLQKLAFNNTVNTAPLDAIRSYIHKNPAIDLDENTIKNSKDFIFSNISIEEYNQVCNKLLADGLVQFEKSYEDILKVL